MLALDIMGIDVGPLVASLGIGGVALALALQGVEVEAVAVEGAEGALVVAAG